MPKNWTTSMLAPRIRRDSLGLAPGLTLHVDMCLSNDPAGTVLNAMASLRSDTLHSDLMSRIVYNGDESVLEGERAIRSRLEAVKMAREWQKAMPRILKSLRRPLEYAEP